MKQSNNVSLEESYYKNNQETKAIRPPGEKNSQSDYFRNFFQKRLKERFKLTPQAQNSSRFIDKKFAIKTRTSQQAKKSPKEKKNSAFFEPQKEPPIQNVNMISRLEETNRGIVVQAQAQGTISDEINKLIKKMTLGFSVSKNDSSFFMKDGLFAGAYFHLNSDEKNLTMNVQNGSEHACQVLRSHQDLLKFRLQQNEINLERIMFS